MLLHHARLHGGGLRAQKNIIGDIKRVLRVSCRVVFRNIERLEVIIIVFDLRPLRNGKAHADKNIAQLFFHL